MTKTESARYREILEHKQAELVAGLQVRDEIAIEKCADQIDEIQRAVERDLTIGDLDRKATLLRNVRAALVRMNDGGFGTCVECDEPITPKRLAAVPWTPMCIRCQETADRRQGETGRNSGELEAA